MRIEPSDLEGVVQIWPDIFEDHRGLYVETYNEHGYLTAGIDVKFVQDDFSISRQHVLRGLHGDRKTWKLISCVRGDIYVVVLDYRDGKSGFGQWRSFTITSRTFQQILIPPGYALGHLVLSDVAIFHYKQSTYYDRASQFTVAWNDPRFAIWWPIRTPILSTRDDQPASPPRGIPM